VQVVAGEGEQYVEHGWGERRHGSGAGGFGRHAYLPRILCRPHYIVTRHSVKGKVSWTGSVEVQCPCLFDASAQRLRVAESTARLAVPQYP